MTGYIIATGLLHLLGMLVTLRTKPGAPRGPEPPASTLLFTMAIHVVIVTWGAALLLN